ncbi:MAG: Amt family ammonium transporter [Sulfurimonas sp.]|jgi:Amt family ammonium transporter
MSIETATVFAEQVSVGQLLQNLVYASGVVGAIFVVVGLLLIDIGGTRTQHSFNSGIEKVVGFFIGFAAYFLIGFAFWASQYYIMEGATLTDSIKDWWAGGTLSNSLAQNVDPAVFPGINNFQIFIFFLAIFAGIINVLLHFAVAERMKASAYYITAFVAAIVSSILSWMTWGSVGPLTVLGFHDFFGVGFVYLFPAGMAMVFVPKLGARPGMFEPHPKVYEYHPQNNAMIAVGIMTVFAGLPMIILSCMFFFDPGALAVSVTMATTSVGIALNNYAAAWAGGAIMGAIIAYSTRKFSYLLFGPLGGYVAGAGGLDVYLPWETFLVAMGAPIIAYVIYELLQKRGIDDHKLLPLMGGVGAYGLIMVGLVKAGTLRGGYVGIEEGLYAFQGSEISLIMQLAGVATCLGAGIVTAWILSLIFENTIGLRVSEEDQAEGLDKVIWGLNHEEPTHENSAF